MSKNYQESALTTNSSQQCLIEKTKGADEVTKMEIGRRGRRIKYVEVYKSKLKKKKSKGVVWLYQKGYSQGVGERKAVGVYISIGTCDLNSIKLDLKWRVG